MSGSSGRSSRRRAAAPASASRSQRSCRRCSAAARPRVRGRARLTVRAVAGPRAELGGVYAASPRSGSTTCARLECRLDPVEALVQRRHRAVKRSTRSARSSIRACRSARRMCLEPLEPADRVVRQALHLGEAPRDRGRLFAQAVAERAADCVGQHHLQLVCGLRERLHLEPGPLERSRDSGRSE